MAFATLVPALGRYAASKERLRAALAEPFPAFGQESLRNDALLSLLSGQDFTRLCVKTLEPYESVSPWVEGLLKMRVDCYRAAGSPRLAGAQADLSRFIQGEAQPFIPAE